MLLLCSLARRLEDGDIALSKLQAENQQIKASNVELERVAHQRESGINSEKKIRLFEEKINHSGGSFKNKEPSFTDN